jgi:hypothetical protein
MSVLLVTGIGVLLAGLVAAAFGIPVKEFSFGNTLILSGAVISCTGLVMISLSLVIRELRVISQRLRPGQAVLDRSNDLRLPASTIPPGKDIEDGHQPLSNADQNARDSGTDPAVAPSVPSPLPWQAEMSTRDRGAVRTGAAPDAAASELPPSPDTPVAPKPRRNLLFSSSSRKERERATARSTDPAATSMFPPAPVTATPDAEISPPPSFDDAWPRSDRSRLEQGRVSAAASAVGARTDRDRSTSDSRNQNSPAVTVLKSGVVDGMAYSLYSDGSIEAQMPEGMMRFASIDELRAHLDQRP